MAPHQDEDTKPTADFLEYSDPDKDHAVPTPQKGVDAEQNALYREFESKDEEWHHYMKKKLMRKVDWHLLPLLILMYLLNFLDRRSMLSEGKIQVHQLTFEQQPRPSSSRDAGGGLGHDWHRLQPGHEHTLRCKLPSHKPPSPSQNLMAFPRATS